MPKTWVDGDEVGDKLERGRIVRVAYEGKFGEVFRAFINGLITTSLKYHQVNPNDRAPISAERLLGRCEGYQNVVDGLELIIYEAEELQRPIEEIEETD